MAGIMPGVSLLSKSHVSLLSRSLSTTSVTQVRWGFVLHFHTRPASHSKNKKKSYPLINVKKNCLENKNNIYRTNRV